MTVVLTPAAAASMRERFGDLPAWKQPKPKRHKFGAKRCEVHEGRHASLKECKTFQELQLLERAGEIRNLREQVPIELAPSVVLFGRKKPALRIVIDFVYEQPRNHPKADVPELAKVRRLAYMTPERVVRPVELPDSAWQTVYHDAKGMETDVWRTKAHLLALKVGPAGGVVVKS